MAMVVRCRSLDPNSRISRSRRSSRCISTKTAMTSTIRMFEIGSRDRRQHRPCQFERLGRGRLDGDGDRLRPGAERARRRRGGRLLVGGRCGGLLDRGGCDLSVQAGDEVRQAAEGGAAHRRDLLLDGAGILRDLGGEAGDLQADHPADGQDQAEPDRHRDQHRGDMRHADAPQTRHHRRQHEGEQDGERDRGSAPRAPGRGPPPRRPRPPA